MKKIMYGMAVRIAVFVIFLPVRVFAQQTQPVTWQNNGSTVCGAFIANFTGGGLTCSNGRVNIPNSSGTVTSVACGTGLTCAPSPIVGAGTVSLSTPVSIANGGTNATAIGVAGSVDFSSGTSHMFTSTSDLAWDNTNKRLGVGNASPSFPLDVTGTVRGTIFRGSASAAVRIDGEFGSPSILMSNAGHDFAGFSDGTPGFNLIAYDSATILSALVFQNDAIISANHSLSGGSLILPLVDATGGIGCASCGGGGGALRFASGVFSGTVTAGAFSGSGASLTSLSASNVSSGTLAAARGGTGLDTSASSGTPQVGAGTWTVNINQMPTNRLVSSSAPTISSGFGTTPSIVANNGTGAFTLNVGTGGVASSGVIGLPAATNGWICWCNDITTRSATVASCRQTASSTTTATIGNFDTGVAAAAWVASDVLYVSCFGF